MKQLLALLFALFFTLNLFSQVYYLSDSIEHRYKHETILLQSESFVKDGNVIPFGSKKSNLRTELEKNGNFESIDQFWKSRKFHNYGLATNITGSILTLLLINPIISAPSVGGVILFMLGAILVSALVSLFRRKSNDYLNRAIWYYNQHILFRKKDAQ
jgi:hypothetical protein